VAKTTVRIADAGTSRVEIPLAPGGTIGGRVLDSLNHPVANGRVEAFSLSYRAGFPILQAAASDTTDDRGEFRLFWLPPGEYYVAVNPNASLKPMDAAQRTYYPGTLDVTKATPVVVSAGSNVEGINYSIREVRTVTLSGSVRSLVPGNGGIQAVLLLMLRDDSIPDNTGERVAARTLLTPVSGRFEIPGVAPGSYDVYARIPDSNPDRVVNGMTFGRASVDVFDEDISGIQIDVHPTVPLVGSFVSPIGSDAWGKAQISVQAEGSAAKIPFYRSAVANRVVSPAQNGTFRLPAVPQGRYRMLVNGLPKGVYVADVRQGALSVFDAGFDVGAEPPAPVQVVLASNGGTLQGIAQNSDGKAFPGATVVLIPTQHRRKNWLLYRSAVADSSGRYTLQGIAPGEYTLFAWDHISPGAYYSAHFLTAYEGSGRAVRVNSSSSATAPVTVRTGGTR
jgi:hypothetical protein